MYSDYIIATKLNNIKHTNLVNTSRGQSFGKIEIYQTTGYTNVRF